MLSDQDGNEIQIKKLTEILKAKGLTELHMSGVDISTPDLSLIIEYSKSIKVLDLSNCTNTEPKRSVSDYSPLTIIGHPSLESVRISGSDVDGVVIARCPRLQTVEAAGGKLESFRIIRCPGVRTIDLSQGSGLRDIAACGCPDLKSITLSELDKALAIFNVSECQALDRDIDLSRCRPGIGVIQAKCPAKIITPPLPPPFTGPEAAAQELMWGVIGENFDQHNPYPDDISFSDLKNLGSNSNRRPEALVPFMRGRHPIVVRPDCWDKPIHTDPDADLYARHGVPSCIKEFPNAYFAEITGMYCITSCPGLQNTKHFFQAFAKHIGTGVGLIVDLHDERGGGEYIGRGNATEFNVFAIEQVGDTTTIENAELLDGNGNKKTGQITIAVHKARVDGKPFFHVRVKGLPDNHAFSTEVQQRINVEVEKIRQEHGVTVTVSHCNGGMGRGPTQMYMDAIQRVARQAQAKGFGCVCDWDKQKLPLVDGKINLAYVARNMVLTGHAARNVCGQSTSQFLQLKQFTEDMAGTYTSPLTT